MKLKNLFLIFLFLALISCNSDGDSCTDQKVNTTSLESEYDCTNTKYDLDLEITDDFIVIKEQTDYNSRLTGNCNPRIDFSTFDLIIGKQQLTSGNGSIDYQLTENCHTGNYVLNVTFNQNIATVAPNLTYHRLIPKLPEGKEITVTTEIKY